MSAYALTNIVTSNVLVINETKSIIHELNESYKGLIVQTISPT